MDTTPPDNVILIGMPGAGKSTLGVVFAKVANLAFIDTDLLIQQRFGKTLQALIEERGVEGFLACEQQVLCDVQAHRSVISTGGSAIYSDKAMEHLATLGTIVYLEASLKQIERRVEGLPERGVVMHGDNTTLSGLYAERAPLYERYAQMTLDVDGQRVSTSARQLAQVLAFI